MRTWGPLHRFLQYLTVALVILGIYLLVIAFVVFFTGSSWSVAGELLLGAVVALFLAQIIAHRKQPEVTVESESSLDDREATEAQPELGGECGRPYQKPARPEWFVGREEEIAAVLEQLRPGRVVTLCGPGGIGKSAIAAEIVWRLAPGDRLAGDGLPGSFPDGILWHGFHGQPQAALALEQIVRSFGAPMGTTPREAASRIMAKKRALLLLDGAEAADDLTAVLEARGECGVLVTTRKQTDAPGVRIDVPALPEQEALALLQRWGGKFATREPAAREINELVRRLPLSVILVGRYLRQREQREVDYLAWLQTKRLEAAGLAEKHQNSVRCVLERSVAALNERARDVLGISGLLAPSPFEAEIVSDVLDVDLDEVIGLMSQLVDYGLLSTAGSRHMVGHALIHEYSRKKLSEANWMVFHLGAIYKDIIPDAMREAAFDWLDAERPHFMNVLRELLAGEEWRAAGDLATTLTPYLLIQSYWTELTIAGQAMLLAGGKLGDKRIELLGLSSLGVAHRNFGQVERAIAEYEQALVMAKQLADRPGEAVILGNLGRDYAALGQFELAIEYHELALNIAYELGDQPGAAYRLVNLGQAYLASGQGIEGIAIAHQALKILRELGDERGVANQLANVAGFYQDQGQQELAIDYLVEALGMSQRFGDRPLEANNLASLGRAHLELEQFERSIDYYDRALPILREINDRVGTAAVLGYLGIAYLNLGQPERAVEYHQQALAITQEIGDLRGEATLLPNLGYAYAELARAEQAIKCMERALQIWQDVGDRNDEGVGLNNLGGLYFRLGQVEQAIDYFGRALVKVNEVNNPLGKAAVLSSLGSAYAAQGQHRRAIDSYERALILTKECGNRAGEGLLLNMLGGIHSSLGQVDQAVQHFKGALAIARESGYRAGEGITLGNLGNAYLALDQKERAVKRFEQALIIFEEMQSPYAEAARRQIEALRGEE